MSCRCHLVLHWGAIFLTVHARPRADAETRECERAWGDADGQRPVVFQGFLGSHLRTHFYCDDVLRGQCIFLATLCIAHPDVGTPIFHISSPYTPMKAPLSTFLLYLGSCASIDKSTCSHVTHTTSCRSISSGLLLDRVHLLITRVCRPSLLQQPAYIVLLVLLLIILILTSASTSTSPTPVGCSDPRR